jgi:hemolysin activation/secretion protein
MSSRYLLAANVVLQHTTAALVTVLIAPTGFAQAPPISLPPNPNPDIDRFPQSLPTPQPLPPNNQQPALPTPTQETPGTASNVIVVVKQVQVTGSTVLKPDEIAKITSTVEGRSVTLTELQDVANALTQLYLNQGYITSRAILVNQKIADGIVQIRVVEGSLEKIEVQGNQRINPKYVRSRLQLGGKPPLSKDRLEDQLRLLKTDPHFTNVEASLKPGSGLGQSILTVRVSEAQAVDTLIGIDNYSQPSVGSERFGAVISYRNLTGFGDDISATMNQSMSGGATSFDFNYRLPVNPMNGTVQVRIAPSRSLITEPDFKDFGIRSKTNFYELSYRQPLVRKPGEEFALTAGLAIQNGQTFLFDDVPTSFSSGSDIEGRSRTRVLKLGQDYLKRDPLGAWALRSQLSIGLDLFNATENKAPIPDGRFLAWLVQAQRVQRLGKNHLLIAQADLQLTPNSLLPSQQFVIGSGQSLRGYRQNARSGDSGFRLSVEDRIPVQRDEAGLPTVQLAPFIDIGSVWNKSSNPNKLTGETFLAAIGTGVIVEPAPRFIIRLDYALPLVRLSDRGNNAQDYGFYFSVNYAP